MGYPTANQVLAGVVFGASDELTGTLVLPAAADVKLDVAVGVSPAVGTLRVPLESQVKNGVSFGPADALTGNVTLPTAARVVAGWSYGAAGAEFTGTYDANLPTAHQVLLGVSFGPSPGSTGNVVLPAPEVVEFGIHYGPQNATVGEFVGATSVPSPAQIVDELLNRVLPNPRMAAGSVGEALQAARADVFGDRAQVDATLRYYAPDGTTVQKVMNVNDPTNPTVITNGD